MPSLLWRGGSGFTLFQIFYLRVSGEHPQLSLRELPEAQNAVFERGLLRFKAKGWPEEATTTTITNTTPSPSTTPEASQRGPIN